MSPIDSDFSRRAKMRGGGVAAVLSLIVLSGACGADPSRMAAGSRSRGAAARSVGAHATRGGTTSPPIARPGRTPLGEALVVPLEVTIEPALSGRAVAF